MIIGVRCRDTAAEFETNCQGGELSMGRRKVAMRVRLMMMIGQGRGACNINATSTRECAFGVGFVI